MSIADQLLAAVKALPAELSSLEAAVKSAVATVVADVDKAAPTIESFTQELAAFVPSAGAAGAAEKAIVAFVNAIGALVEGGSAPQAVADAWKALQAAL